MSTVRTQFPAEFFRFLRVVCRDAASLLRAQASSVFLMQGDTQVVMRAAHGYSHTLVNVARYDLGEGITGWVAQGHEFKADSHEEVMKHRRHKGKYDQSIWGTAENKCHCMFAIPLYIGKRVYGLIKVENKYVGRAYQPFTQDDIETLRIFLRAISHAIETNSVLMSALGRLYVFVLIPFQEKFKNIYELGIKPAAHAAGMRCEKVNEIPHNDDILRQVYECIHRADIVVSVMTGRNPNVFYETGYSHAMGKPTIPLAEVDEDVPFDLRGFNHIKYKAEDISALRKMVKTRLLWAKSKLCSPGLPTSPPRYLPTVSVESPQSGR